MYFLRTTLSILVLGSSTLSWAIPNNVDFRISTSFPPTAGFGWAGTALPDGRYAVWDGNTLFAQNTLAEDSWTAVATGYAGDPAFMVPIPNTTEYLLGAGFSGDVYRFDWDNPVDYIAGAATNIGAHYSAVYLTDTLLAVDRGSFGSPAEIEVFDMGVFTAVSARSYVPRMVLSSPPATKSSQVVEKPAGSFSASIALHAASGRFYVTDSGNGQIKSFSLADVLNAYNTATPLDWNADGTSIGTPFEYPLGGVSGFTASGNLVMGGFGSIVEVDPAVPAIVTSLDPAGSGPFYSILYNSNTEDLIAIQSDYPNPSIIHTTQAKAASVPVNSYWLVLLMMVLPLLYLRRKYNGVNS